MTLISPESLEKGTMEYEVYLGSEFSGPMLRDCHLCERTECVATFCLYIGGLALELCVECWSLIGEDRTVQQERDLREELTPEYQELYDDMMEFIEGEGNE